VVLSAIVPTAIAQRWFSPDRVHRHHAVPDPSGILTGPAVGTDVAEEPGS
jgi:hypothetical protein